MNKRNGLLIILVLWPTFYGETMKKERKERTEKNNLVRFLDKIPVLYALFTIDYCNSLCEFGKIIGVLYVSMRAF